MAARPPLRPPPSGRTARRSSPGRRGRTPGAERAGKEAAPTARCTPHNPYANNPRSGNTAPLTATTA
ncbi:hypothetical protein GCM10018773_26320 [Streptomyces candidus]|nr:hypothetical protein GCM10018773_26320 [Streptomyces candidus]